MALGVDPALDPQAVKVVADWFDVEENEYRGAGVIGPRIDLPDGADAQDRLLTDVLQANVARVSVQQSAVTLRQNEDMRKISAWAAIALVPTAVAGIYGMNFDNMPELEWEYGYFAVLAVIAGMCGTLFHLFKRNRWL